MLNVECMCLGQVHLFCGCLCAFMGLFDYENRTLRKLFLQTVGFIDLGKLL